jgi:hypothetical protein
VQRRPPLNVTLAPGEIQTGTLTWDQTDFSDNAVPAGQHTLVAFDWPYLWDNMADYSGAVADITIVPEPTTLCLLAGIGGAGLLTKRRRACK